MLGKRVEQFRKALGMSRARLAADADVSYTLISQVELGKRDPSASNVAAIAAALGVTVDDLLSEDEVAEQPSKLPPRSMKARSEILAIVDGLEPDELVIVRDMLTAWAARPAASERAQDLSSR